MDYYELSVRRRVCVAGRPLQAKTGMSGMTQISVFVLVTGHSPGAVVDEEALTGLNGGLSHMGLTAVERVRDRRILGVGLKDDERCCGAETRQPFNDPPKAGKGRDITWPSSHRGRVAS